MIPRFKEKRERAREREREREREKERQGERGIERDREREREREKILEVLTTHMRIQGILMTDAITCMHIHRGTTVSRRRRVKGERESDGERS